MGVGRWERERTRLPRICGSSAEETEYESKTIDRRKTNPNVEQRVLIRIRAVSNPSLYYEARIKKDRT